jgi:small acid-soluble spore protein H (minor)
MAPYYGKELMRMDKKRAEQILHTPERIDVLYEGKPVWIEGINDSTANVTFMGSCKTMDVPFMELKESDS